MIEERRNHKRIDSHNLVYLCLKEKEEIIQQGMGRTMNISESGIRLETRLFVKPGQKIWLTIGIEEQTVEIRGELVYYISNKADHHYGIKFLDMEPGGLAVLRKYITNFNRIENQIN